MNFCHITVDAFLPFLAFVCALAVVRHRHGNQAQHDATPRDVATQLREHARVSDHILRKRGNVVRGGWSGAVPLWSEGSQFLYARLNVTHKLAQRAALRQRSQTLV